MLVTTKSMTPASVTSGSSSSCWGVQGHGGSASSRIRLRSRDRVDVSLIAAEFGGGGHAKASGCRIQGTADQVRQALLEKVGKHLSCES